VALIAILDPPRDEAIEAVKVAHSAGIEVKMITGGRARGDGVGAGRFGGWEGAGEWGGGGWEAGEAAGRARAARGMAAGLDASTMPVKPLRAPLDPLNSTPKKQATTS
jgi:hypothetical protein